MFGTSKNPGGPARGDLDGPMGVSWLGGGPDPGLLWDMLREVIDPEIGINIVDLGLVYGIRLADGLAMVRITLTTPGCPLGGYIDDGIHECLWGAPGVNEVDVQIVWEPSWNPDTMMSDWAKDQLGWTR